MAPRESHTPASRSLSDPLQGIHPVAQSHREGRGASGARTLSPAAVRASGQRRPSHTGQLVPGSDPDPCSIGWPARKAMQLETPHCQILGEHVPP